MRDSRAIKKFLDTDCQRSSSRYVLDDAILSEFPATVKKTGCWFNWSIVGAIDGSATVLLRSTLSRLKLGDETPPIKMTCGVRTTRSGETPPVTFIKIFQGRHFRSGFIQWRIQRRKIPAVLDYSFISFLLNYSDCLSLF